jgi:hypothetical protein
VRVFFINSSYVQSALHLHGFLVQCGASDIYSWELLPGLYGDSNPITPESIKRLNESFRHWGNGHMRRYVTDEGEGAMEMGTYQHPPCGCRVIGNGSLPFPFTIKFCAGHAAATEQVNTALRSTLDAELAEVADGREAVQA